MNYKRYCYLLIATCTGLVMFFVGGEEWHHPRVPSIQAEPAKRFTVFDGTLYKNKPDLSQFGVKPIKIIYGHEFWDPGQNMDPLPTQDRVREVAVAVQGLGVPAVIDIEHWPTHKASGADIQRTIEKHMTLLRWFHDAAPAVQVGLYGTVPIGEYWGAIANSTSEKYQSWISDNDRLRPLSGSVNALFPSLYTFYADREGWMRFAAVQLIEARRLAGGRPVYAFLWPQYHDSNRLLGEKYLPAEYWKLELETVLKYADGIVIWGGWEGSGPAAWDNNAGWWKVTTEFLKKLEDTAPPATTRDLSVK